MLPALIAATMLVTIGAPERYGIVLTRGTDTLAVERFTRDATGLRGEVLVPRRARVIVSATTDAGGCILSISLAVYPWGASAEATPVQHVNVRLDGDSVRVDARARDVGQSFARSMPGRRALLPGESVAAMALVIDCARAAGGDFVVVPVAAFPGLREQAVTVRFHGRDSATVVTTDSSRATLDAEGRLVRWRSLDGSGLAAVRVDAATLDRIAFAAPDYGVPADAPYRAEDVRVRVSDAVTLAGTLTMPKQARGRVPAVVTISGSGGQDRDAYAAIADGWRPFRELADTLARRGIAVLRLDDRGVGASTGDQGAATEQTNADDVRAALAYLRTRSDMDSSRLALLGHSEGVRVGMIVASGEPKLAGLVLVSGAADTRAAMRAQMTWVLDHSPESRGLSRDSLLAIAEQRMDSLAATSAREVYRWDPKPYAAKIRARVAIFHGATDRQVPPEQAEALAAVFRGAGHRDVPVRVFAGRNHLLVADPDGDFLAYDRLKTARLDAEVRGAIADRVAQWLSPGR